MMNRHQEMLDEAGLAAVGATVLWIGCLGVGVTGLMMPFQPRGLPAKHLLPVQTALIHVELTKAPAPARNSPPKAAEPLPPPPPAAIGPPPAPPMTAVAAPSAAISFALPSTGPTRIVSAADAIPRGSPGDDSKVQRISEQEAGQQPRPEYPPEAALNHESGSVVVRFAIDENGSVTSAVAIEPCPFPLINQSALRTVRELWRFPPGRAGVATYTFEFDLAHH
jgi:TonB family protein